MLQTLRLAPTQMEGAGILPSFLSPLVQAAERGCDLVPEIEAITRNFGFDSFSYRTATKLSPDEENRIFEFSTLAPTWAVHYDQNAYVEVDPRVIGIWDRTVPMLWDQRIGDARTPRVAAFLEDALSRGIASGICIPLFDELGTKIVVDLVSSSPVLEIERRIAIHRSLGDMYLFARVFHEIFKRAGIEKRIPARNAGMPLSPREEQCLLLAAQGIECEAIGKRLAIDLRFVQSHLDSIRSKLQVASLKAAMVQFGNHGILGN